LGPGRLAVLSSGTSGESKLIVHDHARLLRQAEACIRRFGLTATDTVILPVPIFHMFGLGAAFLPALIAGAAVDLVDQANLPRFLSHEVASEPNVAFMVPSFAETLLKGRRGDRAYRLTVMAGDRVRESTFSAYEARFGPVVQLYGSSEMGAIASTSPDDPVRRRQHTVGSPLEGVELRLDGADGELLMCRHENGFLGYAGEDGAPRPPHEWWSTGDRAVRDDGAIRILGRVDDRLKRDGVLVSLRAVEHALEALPEVRSAAAVAGEPGPRGLELVAFCVVTRGAPFEGADLKRSLAMTASRGLVPDRIELIAQMPLLASGKVDRQALRARATAEEPLRSVKVLQVEPTTRCNFTCGFCAGRKMDQSDLPYETFARALQELPCLEEIELHGQGEPMAHERFLDMADEARRRGIRVSTITNGSMFTRRRIERLLASGIQSILVSIESPRSEEFARLRGGKLEKVVAGIRALLGARRAQGLTLPVVGFAVTVLKDTQHELRAIADLYRELGMDGGIALHMLIPMSYHAAGYDRAMKGQLLTRTEQALSWARYAKIVRDPSYLRSEVVHACDNIYGYGEIVGSGGEKTPGAWINGYDRCPWLDRGLYLNRHAQVTACSRILDGDTYALGVIGSDTLDEILRRRDQMASAVASGDTPAACRGCFIAESIAIRSGKRPGANAQALEMVE
jgi:MoaA/NifB/PqqE/SkfB family radical SAM enzyme